MGKLLRVLTVFFLLFAIGALVLGIMLFNKRELLKGRTQKLESYILSLAPTIEQDKAEEQPANFPGRDIAQVTPDLLPDPQTSRFWEEYDLSLEQTGLKMMNLEPKKRQLMTYYKVDPITQKVERNEITRAKVTSGPGTMDEVLQDLLSQAKDQYNRLNDTRRQMTDLREELVDTILDLNRRKTELREKMKEIVELKAEIARLNGVIRDLNDQIAMLQEEIRGLNDQIAELRREIELQADEIVEKQAVITHLERELERYKKRDETARDERGPLVLAEIAHGEKGRVVGVNPDWKFVVFDLSDPFMMELLGDDLSGEPPVVDLYIKRPTATGDKFITKIRLQQVRVEDKIGIADVLTDWQQTPIQKGDLVFY